jgi:hypothetical protein
MNKTTTAQSRQVVDLDFHSIRNISSPEDLQNNRKVFISQSDINSIVDIPTNENVRNYLAEADGKVRKSYTSVHKAIKETLINDSENFSMLNSGLTIIASDIEIDEKSKKARLKKPSIVNGSQTQGVIKDLLDEGYVLDGIHVKCEIIITKDADLIAEISIARNFQNDVMAVSIAGRRGQFDEIEENLQQVYPKLKLRKSESELPGDNIVDSEKLLQVITALIPEQIWIRDVENENPNKVYTYSMKARCLKEFQSMYEAANNKKHPDHEANAELYNFFKDITPSAYDLYKKWKSHQGFKGTGLRSIERNGSEIVEVPDGIIFPILSSLSVFAVKKGGHWKLSIPANLIDQELIRSAKTVYQQIANSNPQTMGKNKACYSSLLQITNLYKRLTS